MQFECDKVIWLIIMLKEIYNVEVAEDVAVGTAIQRVIASDADEPGTRNSRIEYLLESDDSNLFSIHRRTGVCSLN